MSIVSGPEVVPPDVTFLLYKTNSMIKIIIDRDKVNSIKQLIIKKLILNRAYKGYVWWVKEGEDIPLSFSEFSSFEFWKIELSLRIYFNRFKNGVFSKNYINFKSIILNQP